MDRKTFDDYDSLIKAQANEAMSKINDFANALDYGNTAGSRGFAKEMLQDYAYDCITTYGDNSAEIAARYYDQIASEAGAKVPNAILASMPTREQSDANVAYASRSMWDTDTNGKYQAVDSSVGAAVSQSVYGHVSRAANNTMMTNAIRDKARYARVPTGAHTCAFCMLLASRGFIYHSEQSALFKSLMGKYHDKCDCRAVSCFDDDPSLDGYDPDEMYDQYDEAAKQVPDSQTRSSWNELTKTEQSAYGKKTRGGKDGYNSYRLHAVTAQMREMYGLS